MKSFTLCFCCAAIATIHAATTTTWEMNTYADFVKGRFNGISLDRDGRLTLAPKLDTVFSSGQPAIWSVARASDGTLYLGTGHRGRVYRIDSKGANSLIWTSDEPEVFAVALDSTGTLYAASSPDGKVYRVEKGKAVEFFAPKAKYIWSLAFAPDGSLFVGTGDPGNVYRVDKSGKSELYYETGQSHVTALAFDSHGNALAGTEPNGILYRISAREKAFVLYDASLPEIRSIVPMPDGTVYAAALGGSIANRTGAATAAIAAPMSITVTAPATSITVSDTSTQAGPDIKPKADTSKAAAQQVQAATAAASPLLEIPGVDKSALYKINPDGTAETLWTSKEENVYSMVVEANGGIAFATDAQGRVYRLNKDRKAALLVETSEGEATRLLADSNGLLAATGDMGKLFRLSSTPSPGGSYESPVHDAGTIARWGRINWRSRAGTVNFSTRSGNSARPDKTWSDWETVASSMVKSPNARYIQWRAELSGSGAILENVSIAYLPQNNPPAVRSINVSAQAAGGSAAKLSAGSSATAAYSITVTDTGESSTAAGTPTQALSRAAGSQIQVSWQADDPDGDKLTYTLYFRGEDETEWKLLRTNMFENSLLLDGDVLADGRYFFRVVASDRPSNAANVAREDDLVSSPVLIDNTPPVVTLSAPRRADAHLEVDADVTDQTSPLRRCEYSLDAGPWTPVEAADGVTDSPREQFHIVIDKLRAGEHVLVVRAYDTANNAGLAKVVVR